MFRHIAANALTILIVALALLLGAIVWGQRQYAAPGPLTEPLVMEVDRGEGLSSVAAKLRSEGAIRNDTIFRVAARYSKLDQGLRYGEYQIPPGASMKDILELMNRGGNVVRQVIVPEGWTSWQVVEMLNNRDDLSGEVAELPGEGSLAPAGYDFQRGDTRQSLIDRMRARQDRILAEAWANREQGLPLRTPEELLILASIVEKETGLPEERAMVASVFENRLREGMRLQTDPTVIYGLTLGKETLGRGLRASELAKPTPYNTYLIQGLPPTPIANPGEAAIEATAHPAEGDMRYFVANGTGGHVFSATLSEHNRNVAAWRRIEAEQRRAAQPASD
ncbi:endolytic transglycosylase MltG [Amaricoccus solimangrovi]|uniref:Endolytic murein transglycosylase n=1 Tax=Amaricoccus solimangrovi TaxID=2589815 RepID=A0A501WUV3_9RHOB|nr:endolytic transglycosylase MltG [Amaricoccus solimangrovi]TPE50731.1 endolytic transglycosylase MltG [Amaricoccus solimangrovi]